MPVVTLLNIPDISSFVFATNRLRDAVGGFSLVNQLRLWSAEVCAPADVLFAAGGCAGLRFGDENRARTAMGALSRRFYQDAPGLELVAVHEPFQPGDLAVAVHKGLTLSLPRAIRERAPSVPLLGLSVTANCPETSGPAVHRDDQGQPLAATLFARRQPAHADVNKEFLPLDSETWKVKFPAEVDDLSRNKSSLIGVVHIAAPKLERWLKQQADSRREDDGFLTDLRNVSASLWNLSRDAFAAVVRRVIAALRIREGVGPEVHSRRLNQSVPLASTESEGQFNFPVRPLFLNDKALTFVCEGRLALDLATAALTVFERSDVPVPGRTAACAGVAIVPLRVPLGRAYQMAVESLPLDHQSDVEELKLNWHLGTAGQGSPSGTCRPYRLGEPNQAGTWRWLSTNVLGPAGFHAPIWSNKHHKVQVLRDLLREGPAAVLRGLEAWRLTDPALHLPAGLDKSGGYLGDSTPLLDALDLLDVYLPLEEPPS